MAVTLESGSNNVVTVGTPALFGRTRSSTIERLAFVGEKKWEKGMAQFCRPFTKATIRYFDRSEEAGAQDWIKQ